MMFQLKSVKYSRSLSEETSAFTANIWVDGKKAGYAKNGGFGGPTDVRITDTNLRDTALKNARAWLDVIDPYPVDFSVSPKRDTKTGRDIFARTTADKRKASTTAGYLEDLVDYLLSNYLTLKDIKKVQTAVTWRTNKCQTGEYIRIAVKPVAITEEQRLSVSKDADFIEWLYDKSVDDIASALGYTDEHSGPLALSVTV